MGLSTLGLPNDFEATLPDLKQKTIKWETECYSGTKLNLSAKITFYQSLNNSPYGNLILVPGLATNTTIDPLMKALTAWSLTHRYNIITINTFLGDFLDWPSFEQAQKNTYPEFVALLESCIHFIEPYTINDYSCIIGHSAGATGLVDALNNIVKHDKPINLSAVLLFAPWASVEWHNYFKQIVYDRCKANNFENPHNILPVSNPFDWAVTKRPRYVSVLPKFMNSLEESTFSPELMNKWNKYITIVAGENDKKAPVETLQERFQELQKMSNRNLFKFVVLPKTKHSFLQLNTNPEAVIKLIKSQRKPNSR